VAVVSLAEASASDLGIASVLKNSAYALGSLLRLIRSSRSFWTARAEGSLASGAGVGPQPASATAMTAASVSVSARRIPTA
jgi:hypothetical protein